MLNSEGTGSQMIMKYGAIQVGIGVEEAVGRWFQLALGIRPFKMILAQSWWFKTWYKAYLKNVESR